MTRQLVSACLLALSVAMVTGCGGKKEEQAPLIAMQDFFRNPDQTGYQLSPDGRHLAWLQPWQGRLNVHVRTIGSDAVTRVTAATARDIFGYAWSNNDRIVYIQDTGGDENYHAYAVNLDGSNSMDLTPFEAVQARLVDILEDDDEHMLIAINRRDARIHDVYRLNVNTGELVMVAENPGNIMGWNTDNAGRIRAATTTDGVNSSLLYRETESEPFKTVITTNFKETLAPLYFTFDDQLLYVASNIGRDKTAIFTYDPRTAEQKELIYEHPEVDVEDLLRSRHRKVITGRRLLHGQARLQVLRPGPRAAPAAARARADGRRGLGGEHEPGRAARAGAHLQRQDARYLLLPRPRHGQAREADRRQPLARCGGDGGHEADPVHEPRWPHDQRLPHAAAAASRPRTCPSWSTRTAAPGPATTGASTPRSSSWPTAATPCCR